MNPLFGMLLFTASGYWQGTGDVVSSNGLFDGPCSNYEARLEVSETKLEIPLYKYDCARFSSDWQPLSYVIRGHEIFHGETGDKEGEVRDGVYRLVGSGGVNDELILHILPNGKLRTSYKVLNILGSIQVRGELPLK